MNMTEAKYNSRVSTLGNLGALALLWSSSFACIPTKSANGAGYVLRFPNYKQERYEAAPSYTRCACAVNAD